VSRAAFGAVEQAPPGGEPAGDLGEVERQAVSRDPLGDGDSSWNGDAETAQPPAEVVLAGRAVVVALALAAAGLVLARPHRPREAGGEVEARAAPRAADDDPRLDLWLGDAHVPSWK
jgi:hypothetical protein